MECQNALRSSYAIQTSILEFDNVMNSSIAVTSGLAFCGVVGHPMRHEFSIISDIVLYATRILNTYVGKVICDQRTYKFSRLSSCYFNLQKQKTVKGVKALGNIYEYNEQIKLAQVEPLSLFPIVGRDTEINLTTEILNKALIKSPHSSVIFKGEPKIGKTRFIKEIFKIAQTKSFLAASVFGNIRYSMIPYQAVFQIFEQIHDAKQRLHLEATLTPPLKSKQLSKSPSDYWTFRDLLTIDLHPKQYVDNIEIFREQKILDLYKNLLQDVRCCIIIVDDLHFIDSQSLKILYTLLDDPLVTIFATVEDEDLQSGVRNITSHSRVIIKELSGISLNDVSAMACQFLKVYGIPKSLDQLLKTSSEGRPGWIQSCLLRLVHNKQILIVNVDRSFSDTDTIFPDLRNIFYPKSEETAGDNDTMRIVTLASNFDFPKQQYTIKELALELFQSFTQFQQNVLKVGSVIGYNFTSFMLKKLLDKPSLILFIQAIKRFFDEKVLECEMVRVSQLKQSIFATTGSVTSVCMCYFDKYSMETKMMERYNIAKYAFCRHLHFYNKHMRDLAYNLIPIEQRKELHSRIVDILEQERSTCPNCTETTSIFNIARFNDFLKHLGLKESNEQEEIFETLQGVIREQIKTATTQNEYSYFQNDNSEDFGLWNPMVCTCISILGRIYYQLIKHSSLADISDKLIYFLIQLATVLMISNEYTTSVRYLKRASELCIKDEFDPLENGGKLSPIFRKVVFSRAHSLLGQAYLELNKLNAANVHLSIALRQHDVPILTEMPVQPFSLFQISCYKWFNDKYPIGVSEKFSPQKVELGRCLYLYSKFLVRKHNIKGINQIMIINISKDIYIYFF